MKSAPVRSIGARQKRRTRKGCPSGRSHLMQFLHTCVVHVHTRMLLHKVDVSFAVGLEPFLSPQVASVLEHIARCWMQGPEASLTGLVRGSWNLHKTIIKRQAVTNGILPSLLILPVVGEKVHDKLIDFTECHHFGGSILYRHRYQRNITVRRLCVLIASNFHRLILLGRAFGWGIEICLRRSFATIAHCRIFTDRGRVRYHRFDIILWRWS